MNSILDTKTFDYERYEWRRDKTHNSRFRRQPVGGELLTAVFNSTKNGYGNLFIGVYTSLMAPISTVDLLRHVRRAWISLRWDVPTIAAQIFHEQIDGRSSPSPWITYDVAQSAKEVESWAEETVKLRENVSELDTLRYEIGDSVLPPKDLVPQTFLYLVPFTPTTFGILLHTSHVPFDSAALKILMTKVFEHLSLYILDKGYSDKQAAKLHWGEEHRNILPAVTQILRKHEPAKLDVNGEMVVPELPEEPRDGPAYAETLENAMAGPNTRVHVFKTFIDPPYDPSATNPKPRRAAHTFTLEESNRIIAATRTADVEKFTVNHLLHAALCLVSIIDNQPSPGSDAAIFNLGVVDARKRLESAFRHSEGYPVFCVGYSPLVTPVSVVTSLPPGTDTKSKILALVRELRNQYKAQAALPALLAVGAEQMERMVATPAPPWLGPIYSGDGRAGDYLRESYPKDGPNSVISITEFFFGVKVLDPAPVFRTAEWKGRIMLSADYNELAVEKKVVEGWMMLWAELILSVTG
ncbi:hypothetical protein BD410DRAFT_513360 [Rickenella mellea]|uniref:CoA-dependent acyltransferase n=1 Tax=Rickenella mellea TaxID=50990 RepID=A0A4Y7PRP6_9AGAM|nr:hypothetical protein BD410DRAFT_513360 [Rickenella mellea]